MGIPVGAAWVRNVPELNHYINYPTPELAIAILPEYRKMGIGEDLMNNLYKVCNASGINEISLGVHKDNLPAIRLYQKQGWIKEGDFHDYIMMIRKTN